MKEDKTATDSTERHSTPTPASVEEERLLKAKVLKVKNPNKEQEFTNNLLRQSLHTDSGSCRL